MNLSLICAQYPSHRPVWVYKGLEFMLNTVAASVRAAPRLSTPTLVAKVQEKD